VVAFWWGKGDRFLNRTSVAQDIISIRKIMWLWQILVDFLAFLSNEFLDMLWIGFGGFVGAIGFVASSLDFGSLWKMSPTSLRWMAMM
jgi:hypothetical protein